MEKQTQSNRHSKGKVDTKRHVRMSNKEDVLVTSSSPLKLGFVPGTEGSGRIAATRKAGLLEGGAYLHDSGSTSAGSMTVPPVAVVNYYNTLGSLNVYSDKTLLGVTLFKFYNSIRSRNASVSAYSPFDVLKAFEAISGVATLMGRIRLCLQVLCTAGSQLTTAYPDGLMQALNLSSTDVTSLASYIARYNRIVGLCSAFIVPKAYKLFARRAALASTVYLDDPIIAKSQLLVMSPSSYYKWDVDASSSTVGDLLGKTVPQSLPQLITEVETLVGDYSVDSDMNNIYAEIRKAYSDIEVFHFNEFPVDGEPISVTFDQVLLDQLHNATIVGLLRSMQQFGNSSGLDIVENTANGTLQYRNSYIYTLANVTAATTAPYNMYRGLGRTRSGADVNHDALRIYAHDDQPDEHSTADLCAFKATMNYTNLSGVYVNMVTSCVTEIIERIDIYYLATGSGGNPTWVVNDYSGHTTFGQNWVGDADGWLQRTEALRLYCTFGYLPVLYILPYSSSGFTADTAVVEGDVDNRYPVTEAAIKQLHSSGIAWMLTMD